MKVISSAYMKRLIKIWGILFIMAAINFIATEQWIGIPAFLAGGVTAGLFWLITAERLWRSANMGTAKGKQHMLIGFILRLLMMLLVFAAAINASGLIFGAVVSGFLSLYLLALLLLILGNLRKAFDG